MSTNHTLLAAREEQNGEFFILRNEVEKEMVNYISNLKGKKVYIPNTKRTTQYAMNDSFVRYFGSTSAIKMYGIKEFSYSYYDENDNFVLITITPHGITKDVIDASIDESRLFYVYKQIDNVDVVICNPEGSKFRHIFNYINVSRKDYILCTSVMCITYKSVFDSFCKGTVKFGMTVPTTFYSVEENKNKKFGNKIWITSFDNGYVPKEIDTYYDRKSYDYQVFDTNKNILCVDCVKMIPMDYTGVMGVPASFIHLINTDQFEILGVGNNTRVIGYGCLTFVDNKTKNNRIFIRFRG